MRNTPLKAFANNDDKTKKMKGLVKNATIETDQTKVNANIKKELGRLKKSQEAREGHEKTNPHSRYKKGPQELPKDLQ